MFDFNRANEAQKKAISTVNGPVLIIAGPGTGKTFTLVQRTIYMIEELHIKPEQIMIATFTEKAAKELITRITNELSKRNISVNLNEMYVGTFHSICLRFLKEFAEYSPLQKNYRLLDAFDQQYTVMLNIRKFRAIANYNSLFSKRNAWDEAAQICQFVGSLSEEMVDADAMIRDHDREIAAVGNILKVYNEILEENNLLDFSGIQIKTYQMLLEHQEVLQKIQEKIRYLMVDEYQDTNYIQEQMVLTLSSAYHNVCVVGDDDQGLYRFRGGSIRNILQFPQHFPNGMCQMISLDVNYRSNSQIVDFYNHWMNNTHNEGANFDWGQFRFAKHIKAFRDQNMDGPAIVKITGKTGAEEWHRNVLDFIHKLQNANVITDLNQIAFLFRSVRAQDCQKLAQFLTDNGVPVYSPRSGMFFERPEIKYAIGAMVSIFPQYYRKMVNRDFRFYDEDTLQYYESCNSSLQQLFQNEMYHPLRDFLLKKFREHKTITQSMDYSFTGLFYQILAYEPFASMMDVDMNSSLGDQRPVRNLAKFTELLSRFESLHGIETIRSEKLDRDLDYLFNTYFRYQYLTRINESEDDSEYAPSGHVSFLTFHQSKGMEFPVVIVGSMGANPWKPEDPLGDAIKEKYYQHPPFEPNGLTIYFDFWRLFYTVFSRAQDLLVLTADMTERFTPGRCLKQLYNSVPEYTALSPSSITLEQVKDVNIKDSYSFTSHIAVYQNCPAQYKFLKELKFSPVRTTATMFGQIIHETIEDIHRAAIRGEESRITDDNIRQWLWTNYLTLSRSEHFRLDKKQIYNAIHQVNRYVSRQHGDWSRIREAEVEVSLVKPNYIIVGAIDLIQGQGDTVELVDFKSEKKTELLKNKDRLARYQMQLRLYAYIIEQRTGHQVSKLHLYCTGEENGDPQISFPADEADIQQTMKMFDETVQLIQNKEFSVHAVDSAACKTCDFRFYCHRNQEVE